MALLNIFHLEPHLCNLARRHSLAEAAGQRRRQLRQRHGDAVL